MDDGKITVAWPCDVALLHISSLLLPRAWPSGAEGASLTSGEGDQDYGVGDHGESGYFLLLKKEKEKENRAKLGSWRASSNSSHLLKILQVIRHYLKDYWKVINLQLK